MRLGRPTSLSALLFASFGTVTAVPLNLRAHEPCEKVQQQVDKWFKDNPVAIYPPIPAAPIKPSLAYACLKSMPFDAETALQQLDYLRPVFQWQSTLDYLKNPPREYLSQGLDLLAGFEEIADNVRGTGTKGYASEFEFLADLYTLTNTALSIPEIFLRDDVDNLDHGYTPSPVSTINDVPALDYMRDASLRSGGAHDPDARFNTLFSSLAKDGNIFHIPTDIQILDLEDHTKVKLQNGTVLKFDNTAYVRGNFTGITSGRDLYNSFGPSNGTGPAPFGATIYEIYNKNFTPTRVGYPDPVVESDMGGVRGFLPTSAETPELNDVAVLSINGFMSLPSAWATDLSGFNPDADYRNASIALIQAAKAAGREKLILDFQSNYGGMVTIVFTLYLTLFPQETVFPLLYQLRAHPQFEFLLKYANSNHSTQENRTLRLPWFSESSNSNIYIKPNGSDWPSADVYEFYGPVEHRRSPDDDDDDGSGSSSSLGSYTHASQWNHAPYPSIVGPPWTEPPFHPDNITILTDGECASACAIIVAMLTHKHGIRTVTVGGRPLSQPMQAVGMVKGGPTFTPATSFTDLLQEIRANETVQVPDGVELISTRSPPLRSVPVAPGIGADGDTIQVNLGSMVPWDGDVANVKEDEVPLQFRYEAANCKVFWTWEMMKDMRALWGKVAQVSWAGGRCVEGSSTGEGGRIGAETVGYSEDVRGEGWI